MTEPEDKMQPDTYGGVTDFNGVVQPTSDRTGALDAFAKELIRASWDGCDGGDIIQEAAEKHGLVKRVPFDPAVHHDVDGYGYEAGDPWFVFTDILAEGSKP